MITRLLMELLEDSAFLLTLAHVFFSACSTDWPVTADGPSRWIVCQIIGSASFNLATRARPVFLLTLSHVRLQPRLWGVS